MSPTSGENIAKVIKQLNRLDGKQVSLDDIRSRQNPELAARVIDQANKRLDRLKTNKVNGKLFFAGSVDFMVKKEGDKSFFYILETNGGNSRGFSVMPPEAWLQACLGYYEAVRHSQSENPVILIGHPKADLLLFEKLVLTEVIAREIERDYGRKASLLDSTLKDYDRNRPAIIVAPYHDIIENLDLKNDMITFKGLPIDVLIGDGIARRNRKICIGMLNDNIKSVIVNEIFHITDDKSLTYAAVAQAAPQLARYDVKPIMFWRTLTREHAIRAMGEAFNSVSEILIKPHGGSGGSGIDIITKGDDYRQKLVDSINHYHEKFGQKRDPFPYTICERVQATPAKWRGAEHHFDIRIYVARSGDKIIPTGALSRVAIDPFLGTFTKKSFVVNLSGYGGVDTSRGLGISAESLQTLNLTEEDFVNMYCASAALISYICKEYNLLKKVIEVDYSAP